MPKYAKFMKEILSKKRKLGDYETVMLNEECCAVLQRKLPQKLKDPGSFTIPCTIGSCNFDKVLCDLGASIKLMPLSIFRKLGLGEVKPTSISLQLADRSVKYPRGVIEDVLIKVDKFIFPADFVVLDMEEDREIPLILGRPFLATGRTLIDVQQGKLILRVQDEQVTFDVFEAMKFPSEVQSCFQINTLDRLISETFKERTPLLPLEASIRSSSDSQNTNLVLNWEKCHFMVQEGIVLGHRISVKEIEVDRAKVEVIEKLPPPTTRKITLRMRDKLMKNFLMSNCLLSERLHAVALPTNDARVVINFLKKNIFSRFGTPRAIISDGGKHFCNNQFETLLQKYGVTHRIATPYHP
ncbi:hypothetical protein UlMin_004101 [Ulmus minor]